MLPVPELVPFRLTNQLVGALEPLGVSGILAASMTNILQGKWSMSNELLLLTKQFPHSSPAKQASALEYDGCLYQGTTSGLAQAGYQGSTKSE